MSIRVDREDTMARKMVKCQCGFVVREDSDDRLVAALQKHAREDHKLEIPRETILAMAQPDPGR
jgi:predicted small metal-binding protein